MSIREVKSETGEITYTAYVHLRSKIDPSIRIQRQVTSIQKKAEAESISRRLIREAAHELAMRESRECTWSELVGEYELYQRKEAQRERGIANSETIKDNIAAIRKWTSAWGPRPVSALTEYDIRDVLDLMMADGKSNSHQRKVKQVMSKIFSFAIAKRKVNNLRSNPATMVKLGRKYEPIQEVLNADQIRILLRKAREWERNWYYVWALALFSGMRNGELYALKWTDVDWERRLMKVSRSFSVRHKLFKTTKSGAWRDIPISAELMIVLKELKLLTGSSEFVLPRMWQWSQGQQAEVLRKFCIQIGLPSVRFHALRASFATALLSRNVAPIAVMKIAGWRDLKTMAHYVRLAGVEIAGATESLKFLTEEETMATVSVLFDPKAKK
jgi:integrase